MRWFGVRVHFQLLLCLILLPAHSNLVFITLWKIISSNLQILIKAVSVRKITRKKTFTLWHNFSSTYASTKTAYYTSLLSIGGYKKVKFFEAEYEYFSHREWFLIFYRISSLKAKSIYHKALSSSTCWWHNCLCSKMLCLSNVWGESVMKSKNALYFVQWNWHGTFIFKKRRDIWLKFRFK